MFQVSLDQMKIRRTEIEEFTEKLNRLIVRLDSEIKTLETMESFSEIASWLKQTEEKMSVQAVQAGEMGEALESIIRFYRNSEENILEHLENGSMETVDEALTFTVPEAPGIWSDYLEF